MNITILSDANGKQYAVPDIYVKSHIAFGYKQDHKGIFADLEPDAQNCLTDFFKKFPEHKTGVDFIKNMWFPQWITAAERQNIRINERRQLNKLNQYCKDLPKVPNENMILNKLIAKLA